MNYFYVAGFFFAVGASMLSGTSSAFVEGTLIEMNRDDEYVLISQRLKSLSIILPLPIFILIPYLAESNYHIAFYVIFLFDFIGFVAALLLKDRPCRKRKKAENILKKAEIVLKEYLSIGWLPYVVSIEVIHGIIIASVSSFQDPFQKSIGFSLFTLGILWAVSRILIAIVLEFNDKLKDKINFTQLIMIQGTTYIVCLFCIALIPNKWVVAASFVIIAVAVRCFDPVKSFFYLKWIGDSDNKVTLLSMNSFVQKGFSATFGMFMGYIVDFQGYRSSFLIVGLGMLLVTLIVLVFSYIRMRKLELKKATISE